MKNKIENFEEFFKEHYRLTCMGPNLWRAYNKETDQSASPVFNSKDAAMYFVQRELILQMEEQMDNLLGGTNDVTSVDDGSSLRSGLHLPISRDGEEKI